MDNIIEDDAERESLLAKPTCLIIVGRPVISPFFNIILVIKFCLGDRDIQLCDIICADRALAKPPWPKKLQIPGGAS